MTKVMAAVFQVGIERLIEADGRRKVFHRKATRGNEMHLDERREKKSIPPPPPVAPPPLLLLPPVSIPALPCST